MPNRIFAAQVVRAFEATPIPDAELYVFENGTTTQVTVYADDGVTPLSQPILSESDGTFRAFYTNDNEPVTILIRDASSNPLPGYPVDDVYPDSAAGSTASGVAFNPTEDVPETNVQSAIEAVATLATSQDDLLSRALTIWTTGGTGDAYTITPSPAITAYAAGQAFFILADRTNTGDATINVNGLGTREIRVYNRNSVAVQLDVGELLQGEPTLLVYNGTQFIKAWGNDYYKTVADGTFFKSTGGLLICTSIAVTASFNAADTLTASWTFPHVYAATPAVFVTLPSTSAGTWTGIVVGQVGAARVTGSTTAVSVAWNRVDGTADFESGDSITNVRITAIGRWF